MGLTYARAFVNSHVVTPDQLGIIVKKDAEMISSLKAQKIGNIYHDPKYLKQADLIILAVKPQDANQLFTQINPYIDSSQVILSIMAGITISKIQAELQVDKIMRAMPNLPSQIGLGMTAFTSTDAVSRFESGAIQNLLSTTGKTLSLDNEELIDAVTAISGSGPAYIYYFMDSMIIAAVDMGLKPSEAELLVWQTFMGALNLYKQSSLNCKDWINKVASKGGTTEAAINVFDESKLNDIILNGANAALKRAIELGK